MDHPFQVRRTVTYGDRCIHPGDTSTGQQELIMLIDSPSEYSVRLSVTHPGSPGALLISPDVDPIKLWQPVRKADRTDASQQSFLQERCLSYTEVYKS